MEAKLITAEEFLALMDEDGEPPEEATVVQSGDWEINYKDYATKDTTYKFGEQFFTVSESRSGSYYSDYDYDDPTCYEVVPKEVTVTRYVVKK